MIVAAEKGRLVVMQVYCQLTLAAWTTSGRARKVSMSTRRRCVTRSIATGRGPTPARLQSDQCHSCMMNDAVLAQSTASTISGLAALCNIPTRPMQQQCKRRIQHCQLVGRDNEVSGHPLDEDGPEGLVGKCRQHGGGAPRRQAGSRGACKQDRRQCSFLPRVDALSGCGIMHNVYYECCEFQ